jgi:hypothetical protein
LLLRAVRATHLAETSAKTGDRWDSGEIGTQAQSLIRLHGSTATASTISRIMSFRMFSIFTIFLYMLSLSSHSYGQEFGYDPLDMNSPNSNSNITPSLTSHQFLAFNPEVPLQRIQPATFAQSDAPAHPRPAAPLMFKGRRYPGKRVAESAEQKRMTNAERLARGLPVGVPRWARERSAPGMS